MQIDFKSIESAVVYLHSFGIYGPLVAFILFFIQAIAPIIPYIIIAGAAGMIFGNFQGFLLAYVGALAGACFVYWLTKVVGGNMLVSRIRDKYDFDLTNVNQKHVFWVLLISRIFPLVPTPIINIGSGLGGVSFSTFFISSMLGKLPWAIVYVVLGNYLLQSKDIINTITIIALLLIVSIAGIYYYRDKIPIHKKKPQKAEK
ncbi:MAG: VTT domain-containing protein [Syntrophomonas sp.]